MSVLKVLNFGLTALCVYVFFFVSGTAEGGDLSVPPFFVGRPSSIQKVNDAIDWHFLMV